ncbi:phosphate acetyltransferase [Hydrogenovibrio sp. SC-1]|uniref:phosphate acetyltransferase n=1 Tax=Hydrogenovibrio sp. SC-1 TaxID=2065820 RepID=UPI000C79E047|nr:phosphate acetyltransferase [Hydrogenovibrio sp. SC-1]PLA75273.1 phosphate acetyltransferase [Hydrogenovibrio sp. SC-1]
MESNSLFIAPRERHAGSLLISLGMMSLLRQRFEKIAFFKPLVATDDDLDTQFIQNVFQLSMPIEQTHGMLLSDATELISENKKHALFETLVAQFKQLQQSYDFVLVQGMELSRHASGIDFDINLALSKHFNSAYLPVLNGQAKSKHEIDKEIELESHSSSHTEPFAIFVNRIDPMVFKQLNEHPAPTELPIFFLPEVADLNTPSIQEVCDALDGKVIWGQETTANRLVKAPIVAAMTVEHFLPRVREGDLIIVPGDRSDILMASIMSLSARNLPNIAGILLTGGLLPCDIIQNIITGIEFSNCPILSVATDTYPSAMHVGQVKAKLNANNPRKTNLALGVFDQYVARQTLSDKIVERCQDHSKDIMTPIMFEYGLFEKARKSLKTIVLPEADDDRILQACDILCQRKVVKPILLGNREEILYRASLLGLSLTQVEIIDPNTSAWKAEFTDALYQLRRHKGLPYDVAKDAMSHVSYFATMMVHLGYADGMVSGATHTTADTIRPALQVIKTQPGLTRVSSVFFMCFETRVLVFGDCAVNQSPNAQQLAEIAISSAQTASQFGIEPRIAMLSYASGESGNGSEVDKVRQATLLVKQSHPHLKIEGPIQYDAAIDPGVAKQKLPFSEVAGQATVFIFPDLNTGNNTYKAVQRASNGVAIGPVLQGLRKPINDLSRGCTVADIINTVAITAIQAQHLESQ